jgi:hypothetical protein
MAMDVTLTRLIRVMALLTSQAVGTALMSQV